ncbi:RnaseH-domain-containing protein, partial [Lenzites betulinus]
MNIISDSRFVVDGLTEHLHNWEDKGWLGVACAPLVRTVVGMLRARSAPTTFKWIKGHSGIAGNEGADQLAREGRDKPCVDNLPLSRLCPGYVAYGARLQAMSQKLAYKSIMRAAAPGIRVATERMSQQILASLKEWDCHPPVTALWRAIRGQDVRRRTRDLWWKAIHGALRIGKYWETIPGYEHRAVCGKCNVLESLEHILLECDEPGQRIAWGLAEWILRRKGICLPPWSIGMILGIVCLDKDASGNKMPPATCRFARIVVTETVHMIWKLRCRRVIDPGFRRESELSPGTIEKQWMLAINKRLSMDQCLTARTFGKKAIPRNVVISTWDEVLLDRKALPDDWIFCAGVLVG